MSKAMITPPQYRSGRGTVDNSGAQLADGDALPLGDIIGWDVDNWSRCLSYWYAWLRDIDRGSGRVLVIGERNGGISLWFALLGFRVICTDYVIPVEQARLLHRRWGVEDRVSYAGVNIFEIPYADNQFDVVACKSVIGGLKLEYKVASTRTLENQRLAIQEVRRVLKPHGIFAGAENLAGTRIHQALRKMRHRGNPGWRYLTMSEIDGLFDTYSDFEQRAWGFLGTHWTKRCGLNKICSNMDRWLSTLLRAHWLYISFIRARK